MHPNPAFRSTPEVRNIEFARERSFGTLAVNADDGPLLSHIPFQLSEDGTSLEAHLVRSNPIVPLLHKPQRAAIAVNGPDAYISPDWYEIDDQVPTWNYIAVHLRGVLRLGDAQDLPGVLDRLSLFMENRLLPKPLWNRDKMSAGVFERMCRQIVPVFMSVDDIQATWKLSQNKTEGAAQAAAGHLETSGFGSQIEDLAAAMNNPETESR